MEENTSFSLIIIRDKKRISDGYCEHSPFYTIFIKNCAPSHLIRSASMCSLLHLLSSQRFPIYNGGQ